MPVQIAILDDDHVIRLTRYAISGPGEITEGWAREFFMPEDVEPARFRHGLLVLGKGVFKAAIAPAHSLRRNRFISLFRFEESAPAYT